MEFQIYTDGSALSNKKDAKAGWAFYMPQISYYEAGPMRGTNNQAELRAIYSALHYFLNRAIVGYDSIMIFTDSEYSMKGITGENKVNANREEIYAIRDLINSIQTSGIPVQFYHVMAHTGKQDEMSKNNAFVDEIARNAASSIL